MADSKPFKLAPLPEPENEPKDERSTAFHKALSAEKATDVTSLVGIQEFEEDDPDRLRQEALENLGWAIICVWSTDWFGNPNGEVNRLVEKLENAARRAAP